MKVKTLTVAALIAAFSTMTGTAVAQAPAPKEPVKTDKAQAKKEVKKDAKTDKAAPKTESTPKK
jgi:hypothetical protein